MKSHRRRSFAGRDQAASAFSAILMRLCDATGAIAAALVDAEGETVDYAGLVEPFQIKVAAAEWRIVLQTVCESNVPFWSETQEILVRAQGESFVIVPLAEGYALVAQLRPRCFGVSRRAIVEATRELSHEAQLPVPPVASGEKERWSRIDVQTWPQSYRPAAIWLEGAWCSLEILGRYTGAELGRREVGYRARLATGAEVTLVREPMGRWYVEDLPG